MNFASDNTAGIAPEILQALVAGNDGFAMGYGNDDVTRAVERRIGEIFERDAAVFLVPTGTAANALALAHVSPPWGAVFAHAEAHILTDECGAPEFFGGGLKLVGMPGIGCKVTPETLAETVSHYEGHTPHQVVPAAFSFAQASEAGTIYRPDEIAALAKVAHRLAEPGIGRIGDGPAAVLDPQAKRLHRVVHMVSSDPERAYLACPRRQRHEVEDGGHGAG